MFAAKKSESVKAKAEKTSVQPNAKGATAEQTQANPLWTQLATRIQAKLTVSAPDDPLEREADRVADQVMRMPEPRSRNHQLSYATARANTTQRKCAACEEDEKMLQRKSGSDPPAFAQSLTETMVQQKCASGGVSKQSASQRFAAQPIVQFLNGPTTHRIVQRQEGQDTEEQQEVLGDFIDEEFGIQAKHASDRPESTSGPPPPITTGGSPLPISVRSSYEARFGRDFGAVRIHTDTSADRSARSYNARAYTVGSSVVFRSGEFAPDSSPGTWLLAHELAHVAQQGQAPVLGSGAALLASSNPVIQRVGDTTLPTVQKITEAWAKDLDDQELDLAIDQLQAEIDIQQSSSPENQYLFTNMDILTAEKDRQNATDVPFTEAEFDVDREGWSPGKKLAGMIRGDPANLRDGPSASSGIIAQLALNKRLVVEGEADAFYKVKVEDGSTGFVSKDLVETNLPDPEAELYLVKSGDTAQKVVQNKYGQHSQNWGADERDFVNILWLVNQNFDSEPKDPNPAIKQREGKDPFEESNAWEKMDVVAGMKIWLPGVDFAKSLLGIIPAVSVSYRTWQVVKDFFVGAAGFVVGLLQGALESIVDIFVGLWDLGKLVWNTLKSLITGEFISDLKKLWDLVSNIDISQVFDAAMAAFIAKWNHPDTWERWKFRGYLVGYALMEVITLFFSGGATALKWLGKAGKLAKILETFPMAVKVINKVKTLTGPAADVLRTAARVVSKVPEWVVGVLRIPLEIIKDTAASALERLKKLPAWIQERFRWLNPTALKAVLGCASPCAVDLDAIVKYFENLAPAAVKAAKKLTSVDDIIAALPFSKKQVAMIQKKLKSRPALLKLIQDAELTDLDFVKLKAFLTSGDYANPAMAYRTFVRYVTNVVPVKTKGDLSLTYPHNYYWYINVLNKYIQSWNLHDG